ncbi:MAG: alanine racemase [Vicinamibacterales bacterium]|nr:alanine racemase [Vicinamibacterales bacterium]
MTVDRLATPSVLVERSRLHANIDRMQAAADRRGVRLRPHAKTHKSPAVADWQIARGAVGICCAKLGEAEVFAGAGVADIRLPYPLHPVNAARVVALLDQTRLSFIVDHPDVARGWSQAMTAAGREVDVLVKVDVGFHRCGIDPALPGALEFIRLVASLPGLGLRGLLSHAGQAYHATSADHLKAIAEEEAAILTRLATAAREAGIAIEEVSAGATPPARFSLEQDGLSELRPGNYAYFDRTQVGLGAATLDDCALTVLARVVSAPAADRAILDCGSKTLSNDLARGFSPLPGHGTVFRGAGLPPGRQPDTGLTIERLSEEHATVRVEAGAAPLAPGDLVRVLPNHSCVVSNLVDRVWLVDGPDVIEPLPVAARGRLT